MDRQDIDALLIGALYGELTPADEARLAAHLDSHPTDRGALDDLKSARFLQDRGAEILDAAGALRVTKAPVAGQTSSMHLLGTCRMGDDPATSVVDKYHRSHEVPNLFVCDGSSLVTSGRGQPTMTIQALAFRAGEHIARFAKRGEV